MNTEQELEAALDKANAADVGPRSPRPRRRRLAGTVHVEDGVWHDNYDEEWAVVRRTPETLVLWRVANGDDVVFRLRADGLYAYTCRTGDDVLVFTAAAPKTPKDGVYTETGPGGPGFVVVRLEPGDFTWDVPRPEPPVLPSRVLGMTPLPEEPTAPMQEVVVKPWRSGEPLTTVERDERGRWWHMVDGKVVRRATPTESLRALLGPQV